MTPQHDTTAMILAAGLGTRLKTLTQNRPKALVELNGKPLLQHCIENLIANGFRHLVINVHHFGEQVIDFVEHNAFDAEIMVSDERQQLMDTGGGIVKASPLFRNAKAVLVHNVDVIHNVNLMALSQQFLSSDDDAWLLTQDRDTNRKLLFGPDNQLVGWTNKAEGKFKWVDHSESALLRFGCARQTQDYGPLADNCSEMAFSGMHFFRSDLFAQFEEKPLSVIDLYLHLAKYNRIVSKPIHPDYWFDLGKPQQLQSAERYLRQRRSEEPK